MIIIIQISVLTFHITYIFIVPLHIPMSLSNEYAAFAGLVDGSVTASMPVSGG